MMLGICNIDVPKPCEMSPPIPLSLKLMIAKPIICAQQPAVAAPAAAQDDEMDMAALAHWGRFLVFAYALPISAIVWLVFNSIWFNRRRNYLIISLLMWTVLAAVFLSVLAGGYLLCCWRLLLGTCRLDRHVDRNQGKCENCYEGKGRGYVGST